MSDNLDQLDLTSACDRRIQRDLQIAFDQVDRGDVTDLNMEAILDEAHRRRATLRESSDNTLAA